LHIFLDLRHKKTLNTIIKQHFFAQFTEKERFCGKIINMSLFFNFYEIYDFLPVDPAQKWGNY